MPLNERIYATLIDEGRTQTWLSEKTGIPRCTLSAYLTGRKKSLTAEDYYAICKVLDKPCEYFMQDSA